MGALEHAFLYLVAAVVAVPVATRLGLGSVLGYLIAGVFLGPVLGLVGSESEEIKHFAEFGVVMMLFLVGLELQPKVLWRMRSQLLGLGGMQVVLTTLVFTGAGLLLGAAWQSALAIGMTLALSSTAIVLQTLNEKGWMKGTAGQSSFSVLLFQDIAVIPMLALLPLLAVARPVGDADGHHGGALEGLPGWLQVLAILGCIAGIVFAGRYLMRPIFRFVAGTRLREVFTAAALLLVIGVALLMSVIGLSPALGTFLAGVVLSDSEYRRELEGDIDPFKGLLLGLFFLSVGAGIDFELLASQPGTVVGLAAGLVVLKLLVLLLVGFLFGLRGATLWLFGLGLAQAGEFAFVLFGFAQVSGVIPTAETQVLVLSVALTMVLTPALFVLYERVIAPRIVDDDGREPDAIEERGTAVVAGVGRFGLVVSRMLSTNGYRVVVLDHDADLVELLRRLGIETFYGDASRPDLLEAAGLAEARLFVAGLDDRHRQTEVVQHVARHFPGCRIVARARDYEHQFELERAGAHSVHRELLEGALSAGRRALVELGMHPFKAERQSRAFRHHDEQMVADLRTHWTGSGLAKGFVGAARARVARLSELMEADRMVERHDTSERGWTPPPKGDAVV
jgi:CPA2 family monovalent cation:H+ antiporter-2/glutathione-regulated potassium-efflux system ancillary protein KefC